MKWHRHDTEYIQPSDQQLFEMSKNRNLTSTLPTKPQKRSNFLTKHANEIWRMHLQGEGSEAISDFLCREYGVGKETCTRKKVTNWISYRKKAKKGKSFPVSLQNKNLSVNFKDQKNWHDRISQIAKEKKDEMDIESLIEEEEEDEEKDEEEEEEDDEILSMKLLRIFIKSNQEFMVIFAEYGWRRFYYTF